MKFINNKLLKGTSGKDFSFDLFLPDKSKSETSYPLLIFAHGFKGFKDWGHWEVIAEAFAKEGIAFLKFNFSHNGTSPNNLMEFCDLEAFSNNTFSKELDDLKAVTEWVFKNTEESSIDPDRVFVVGHSRGGPIAILSSCPDARIKGIITWASVHELDYAWHGKEFIKKWEEDGVIYAQNARTGQKMPMKYSLYEDFVTNKKKFSVKRALENCNKPILILHGTEDNAVKISSAEYLKKYAPNGFLKIIEGADHVFGGKHPYPVNENIPLQSHQLVKYCLDFISSI